MGYRDETEALRARVETLEAKLAEAERAEGELRHARIDGGSVFSKTLNRSSQSLPGSVSSSGVEAMRQALWARLGDADATKKDGEAPPGKPVLEHMRGDRAVRVVEASGSTHVTLDHRSWSRLQALAAIGAFGAVLALASLAGGVHHDWIEMLLGLYAVAATLGAPIAMFRASRAKSESADILKEVVRIAQRDLANPTRVRAPAQQSTDEHVDEEAEESRPRSAVATPET